MSVSRGVVSVGRQQFYNVYAALQYCTLWFNVGWNPSIEVSVVDITYEQLTKGYRVNLRVSVSNSVHVHVHAQVNLTTIQYTQS